LKLPIRFCGEALAREVAALPEDAWIEHPQKFDGNIAVPLISVGGEIGHRAAGPMGPTSWLNDCPYIAEIMQAIPTTWGRSRLMGLEAGAVVPEHVDVHYYWRTHLRLHIPVITNPEVGFTCAGETIHMQTGECWLLDSFYRHSVANRGKALRIHLVLDTVGSGALWDLIRAGLSGDSDEKFIEPGKTPHRAIDFEQVNSPLVMSPWELQTHIAYLIEWTADQPGRDMVFAIVDRFAMAWTGAWARYGLSDEGLPTYFGHLNDAKRVLANYSGPPVMMRNGFSLVDAISHFILSNAIAPAVIQQMQSRQTSPVRLTA
jgi:hypothetical protein